MWLRTVAGTCHAKPGLPDGEGMLLSGREDADWPMRACPDTSPDDITGRKRPQTAHTALAVLLITNLSIPPAPRDSGHRQRRLQPVGLKLPNSGLRASPDPVSAEKKPEAVSHAAGILPCLSALAPGTRSVPSGPAR